MWWTARPRFKLARQRAAIRGQEQPTCLQNADSVDSQVQPSDLPSLGPHQHHSVLSYPFLSLSCLLSIP